MDGDHVTQIDKENKVIEESNNQRGKWEPSPGNISPDTWQGRSPPTKGKGLHMYKQTRAPAYDRAFRGTQDNCS